MTYNFEQAKLDAGANYSRHMIIARGEWWWRLQRPEGDSIFWAEVIVRPAGTVIVHGDGPDIIFRSYQHNTHPESLVRWLGGSGVDYIGSKICCGKRNEWDQDLAGAKLRQYVGELKDQLDEEHGPHRELERMREILERMPECEYEMAAALHRACDYWEGRTFGVHPSWDLVAAQAVCRKLTELLDAERAVWERRAPATIPPTEKL